MSDKKLVAFDVYETRVDSWSLVSPYQILFSRLGIEKNISHSLAKLLMTTTQNIEQILPKINRSSQEIDTALACFYDDIATHLSQLKVFPDFEPTIHLLREKWYKTAAISNLSKLYAYPFDYMIEPNLFDYKALSFETWFLKPDRRIFEHVLYQAGIQAHEAIMVGDNLKSDIQWASTAGMRPVHINRSSQKIVHRWWYTQITTLPDLFSLLT